MIFLNRTKKKKIYVFFIILFFLNCVKQVSELICTTSLNGNTSAPSIFLCMEKKQWVLSITTLIFIVQIFQPWWCGVVWTDFQQTLLEDTKMLQKPRFILKKEVGVTVMNLLLTKLKTISNTLINPFSFGHTTFSKLKPFTS